MLHNRAAKTTAACAAGTVWSSTRRESHLQDDSITCLAHGHGSWRPLGGNDVLQTEPYLLRSELKFGRESRHWWGICDADMVKNQSVVRAPRTAVLQQWVPDGKGCAALRKQHDVLPDVGALACAFCARHAGRSVLFVGDSVQGELFLAFASILGVVHAKPNQGQEGCRKVAPRGSGPTELDVSIQACGEGEQSVTVRFIRNELLSLDDQHNARTRHPDRKFGAPALMLCDWRWAAAAADFIVINRGYHSLTDPNVDAHMRQLNDTVREIAQLKSGRHGSFTLRNRVVYRGTHGSLHGCFAHDDPQARPWSEVAAMMASRSNAQYNWRSVESREKRAKDLLASLRVPYLDTFVSTSYRPGGRVPKNNWSFAALRTLTYTLVYLDSASHFLPPCKVEPPHLLLRSDTSLLALTQLYTVFTRAATISASPVLSTIGCDCCWLIGPENTASECIWGATL